MTVVTTQEPATHVFTPMITQTFIPLIVVALEVIGEVTTTDLHSICISDLRTKLVHPIGSHELPGRRILFIHWRWRCLCFYQRKTCFGSRFVVTVMTWPSRWCSRCSRRRSGSHLSHSWLLWLHNSKSKTHLCNERWSRFLFIECNLCTSFYYPMRLYLGNQSR